MVPAGQFVGDLLAHGLEGHEQGHVAAAVEDGQVGDELEDLVRELLAGGFDVAAVEDVFAAELVAHVGHEREDAVVAFEDALEFFEEHHEGHRGLAPPAQVQRLADPLPHAHGHLLCVRPLVGAAF